LLHLEFGPFDQYDRDLDGFFRDNKINIPGKFVWSANYCTLKDSEQHSNAVVLPTPFQTSQNSTDTIEENPHTDCGTANHPTNKDNRPHLQVLRTCRQIYLEASRVLWNTNTFSFDNPNVLKMFMDNRKTAQKQLLRKLHLDMRWHWRFQKRAWEKVLTLTLVRSLKGLRTFHLYIEQWLLNREADWEDNPAWETDLLSDTYFEGVMKLKILPLETVTVNIANGPELNERERHLQWPLAGRAEWAERLKRQLLDPEGTACWQERQDHIREAARQKKEERAQIRAKQTCFDFSSEEECAEFYQERQDDKDKRSGRVRKAKKVAGPCGRQHMCLLCFLKGVSESDRYEAARNCPRPGHCNVVDETTS
jgi:hypothetical protein